MQPKVTNTGPQYISFSLLYVIHAHNTQPPAIDKIYPKIKHIFVRVLANKFDNILESNNFTEFFIDLQYPSPVIAE